MQKIKISGNVYRKIKKGILRLEKCKVNKDILSIPGEIFYKSTKYKISEIGDKVFDIIQKMNFFALDKKSCPLSFLGLIIMRDPN